MKVIVVAVVVVATSALFLKAGDDSDAQVQPEITNQEMRPEIKKQLDKLAQFSIASVEHTTDSELPPPKKRTPVEPVAFDAGRFRVTFVHGAETKAVILQTEGLVGHYARVVPGKTKIGGFVTLAEGVKDDAAGIQLNPAELDYFIQGLYRRFAGPLTDSDASLLNKAKDQALAIWFDGKPGIEAYHRSRLKDWGFR